MQLVAPWLKNCTGQDDLGPPAARAAASPEDKLLLLRNTELHEFVGAPPGGSGSWFHGDRDY